MFTHHSLALGLTLLCWSITAPALAFPGFVANSGSERAVVHSTHVVVMQRGGRTAVTVMPDYEGPLEPFGLVMVVPADVTADKVITLKRDFVDRLDKLSAPRFHDFYEPDPCEPGEWGQEWERNLKATSAGAILGEFKTDPSKKVAKELFVDTEAKTKSGEYEISVLDDLPSVKAWLAETKLEAPPGALEALKGYLAKGMRPVVLKADEKRIELVGGERAQLSPIRFWTEKTYDSLPVRLGLSSAGDFQELIIYVLDPKDRYKIDNYHTVVPPTNVTVTKDVWERVGEFYNAVYDQLLKKDQKTFLLEFAWPIEGCGQPCPDAPMTLSELMSLGGDVFEDAIPEGDRMPAPGPPSEEEEKKFEAGLEGMTPKEKKDAKTVWEEERARIAYVKALQKRNQYLLTRLHYRYDKDALSEDPRLASDGHLKGGTDLPKGPTGEASSKIEAGTESQLQIRFNFLEPNRKVVECQNPQRWRWGKRPREVRRLRKTWVAQDLTRKSRTQINPEQVILSAVPELGLKSEAERKAAAAQKAVKAPPPEEKKSCGCRLPGARAGRSVPVPLAFCLLLGAGLARRKRRQLHSS